MKITFFVRDMLDNEVTLSGTIGDLNFDISGDVTNGMDRAYLWRMGAWDQIAWKRGKPFPHLLEPHIAEIEAFISKVTSI